MKKKSLVALVATLLIVAGVGTAYASKFSSEKKTEATGEFAQAHLNEVKDRQEARKESMDSREEKDNFDNEKKGELNRVAHYITNLERSGERATRLASARALFGYVRPVRTLDASGETSESLMLKLKEVQAEMEGAGNAEDLEKSVEALTDLVAPTKK